MPWSILVSRTSSRRDENTGFRCARCGLAVPPLLTGGFRNHCPHCLWSLHVDVEPGDRLALCRAPMEPVAVIAHARKGWQIVHRCTRCGSTGRNRVALDDPRCPDSATALGALMAGSAG